MRQPVLPKPPTPASESVASPTTAQPLIPGDRVQEIPKKRVISRADLPDLRVELELPGGDVIYPLQIRVWNNGRRPAPTSQLTIQWAETFTTLPVNNGGDPYHPINDYPDRIIQIPALEPNAHYNVPGLGGQKLHCTAPYGANWCRVRVTADSNGHIMELNESNNVVEEKMRVTAGFDTD